MTAGTESNAERQRLDEDARRVVNWRRWGPYLAERQWGTVREDYSPKGDAWGYLPHDHARSRAYRWGEDGLLGITDHECRLCFALALWNGKDPILKERLFGLAGPEGNHGEDVKELYYFLDATPTFSYARALYKYPQAAFPYARLVEENRRRSKTDPEYDLADTGVFDGGRYFDVFVEYAKADAEDLLVRITCANRGPDPAPLHVLPSLWQRNTWAWGRQSEGYWPRGRIERASEGAITAEHPSLGRYRLSFALVDGNMPRLLFTENETHCERLFGVPSVSPYVKDAFHRCVVDGDESAVNPGAFGTKAAAWYTLVVPPGGEIVVRARLSAEVCASSDPFDATFDQLISRRQSEANAYYSSHRSAPLSAEERLIVRQADAGLVWSRQFYHFIVGHWLDGDPAQPPPPASRRGRRDHEWRHFWARDVLSMPDTWEYPWFAAWDLAFHCVAMARVDPEFAKAQLLLLGREWYMHPNGQIPAYEYEFGDVNPPVQAWAAWRVYQMSAQAGWRRDRRFLERAFHKCLVNFTWWVNRKDADGNSLFAGGFLGLDNIGVFDRSHPLPGVGNLEQADASAWMAFYCTTLLAMSLELAREDEVYADLAWNFFARFVSISRAMNELGGTGLWHDDDGFYYDQAVVDGRTMPLRVRSMVGLIPLFAAESLDNKHLCELPIFQERLAWFLENRPELAQGDACMQQSERTGRRLLAIVSRERLERVLAYVVAEDEFLSPFGVRSTSRVHREHPFVLDVDGRRAEVHYAPAESDSGMFGGNSNWRGPVWFPLNYLLIEALKRHHHFYGDSLTVDCPTGSGQRLTLLEVAEELERRLARLFLCEPSGRRPCHGDSGLYGSDPHFSNLVLFNEYFHGDTGRGLGASHQTGWTALAANVLERTATTRAARSGIPGG